MVSYVKDAVSRFQTMNGKKVERRLGWDCHGLPAEMSAEKQLGVYLGLAAIPATYISFGRLMDYIYPVFGFAGIFLMIVLALMGRKKYNIEDNKLRGRGKICRIQKITKQKS